MTPPETFEPTDAELRILRVLWRRGPSTVRQVHEDLSETRPTAHTTTLKLMQIMTEKGLLSRDETIRPQIYRPCATQKQTQKKLLRGVVKRVFDGSGAQLVMRALATHKASPEELAEIRQLLDELEGKRR